MASHVSFHDLVPRSLRQQWRECGYYPDRDIFTLFTHSAARNPEREAVVDAQSSVTYARLFSVVEQIASELQANGCKPGDVVGVQLPNGWRAVAVELAVAAIGGIVLSYPIGRGWRGGLSMLKRSRAVAVIMPSHYRNEPHAEAFQIFRRELPDLRRVFTLGADVADCRSLEGACSVGRSRVRFRPPAIDPDGPARILVSSGSEAEPKMVLYSHNALAGGRGAFIEGLRGGAERMRCLFLVPLGSAYGSSASFVTVAHLGETLLLLDTPDAERAINMIERAAATHVFAVPTMLDLMLAAPRAQKADFRSLKAVMAGGSSLSEATARACRERFGCAIVNVYGSADGVNSHTPLDADVAITSRTVGRPRQEVTAVRICNDDGQEVPMGAEGEIYSRGPMSPMCYFAEPELDERHRTEDGWVRTGDLGVMREDGSLSVVGRKKDIIVRGGYNISPAEIEQLVQNHPAVLHAVGVGVPDRVYGEKVCLCIVFREGHERPDLAALREFLVDEHGLEHRKLPDMLRELDELPMNAAGKVDKRALKKELAKSATPSSSLYEAARAHNGAEQTAP